MSLGVPWTWNEASLTLDAICAQTGFCAGGGATTTTRLHAPAADEAPAGRGSGLRNPGPTPASIRFCVAQHASSPHIFLVDVGSLRCTGSDAVGGPQHFVNSRQGGPQHFMLLEARLRQQEKVVNEDIDLSHGRSPLPHQSRGHWSTKHGPMGL